MKEPTNRSHPIADVEYRLFYRSLLQKRPINLRSLLFVATPYGVSSVRISIHVYLYVIYIYIIRTHSYAIYTYIIYTYMYIYIYVTYIYTWGMQCVYVVYIHIHLCVYVYTHFATSNDVCIHLLIRICTFICM